MMKKDQQSNDEKQFKSIPSEEISSRDISRLRDADPPQASQQIDSRNTRRFLKVILVLALVGILFLSFQLYAVISHPTSSRAEQSQPENAAPSSSGPIYARESHVPGQDHRHELGPFGYATVGVPKPGQLYNSTKVPSEKRDEFDSRVNQLFQPFNDTDCEYGRVGGPADGGYVLCKNLIENSKSLLNIGIDINDDFGCDLTTSTSIRNYQFDCTVSRAPACRSSKNSHFQSVCVGEVAEKTRNHTYYTLLGMIQKSGGPSRLILQIDCEGDEYSALKYLPSHYLDNIDMIVAELHFDKIHPEEWGMLDIFETLAGKFVSVNYHMNNNGCLSGRKLPSRAVEVTLVNRKLIRLHSQSRSFRQHGLNSRNNPRRPDCQLDP